MTGIVRWFNSEKGYGFIASDEAIVNNVSNARDVFVHHTSISMDGFRKLDPGDRVEFEVRQGDRGLYADQVKVVETGFAIY